MIANLYKLIKWKLRELFFFCSLQSQPIVSKYMHIKCTLLIAHQESQRLHRKLRLLKPMKNSSHLWTAFTNLSNNCKQRWSHQRWVTMSNKHQTTTRQHLPSGPLKTKENKKKRWSPWEKPRKNCTNRWIRRLFLIRRSEQTINWFKVRKINKKMIIRIESTIKLINHLIKLRS